MNDTRVILCDDCSEPALEYEADMCADQLEGKRCECESCGVRGKVILIEDEEYGHGGSLRFRALTEREIAEEAAEVDEGLYFDYLVPPKRWKNEDGE